MGVRFESTGLKDEEKVKEILRERGFSVCVWSDPPGTFYPLHTHPGREVRWVVEGEVTIGMEDREFTLREGDTVELDPETPHWAKTERGVRYVCGSE